MLTRCKNGRWRWKHAALTRTCCVFPRFPRSRLSTAAFLRARCSRLCSAAASGVWVREVRGSDQSSPPDRRSSYSCFINTANTHRALNSSFYNVLCCKLSLRSVHVPEYIFIIITRLGHWWAFYALISMSLRMQSGKSDDQAVTVVSSFVQIKVADSECLYTSDFRRTVTWKWCSRIRFQTQITRQNAVAFSRSYTVS